MRSIGLSLVLMSLVACGGGGDDDGTGDDDGAAPDATASSVVEVDCASATIAETITTSGFAYSPESVTISASEVVEFTPAGSHDVASNDGLFSVGFGGHKCFRFEEAGTFDFHCTPHLFVGTVIVQ
jgi:plastocyanin